ncbi:hypothetical protein K438DRAFT_1764712 [Mycena galopus ATCC 62051]|nr:hypothetical protein K438DRAFT_1764712 [Mycena galopus ATCC 62051]
MPSQRRRGPPKCNMSLSSQYSSWYTLDWHPLLHLSSFSSSTIPYLTLISSNIFSSPTCPPGAVLLEYNLQTHIDTHRRHSKIAMVSMVSMVSMASMFLPNSFRLPWKAPQPRCRGSEESTVADQVSEPNPPQGDQVCPEGLNQYGAKLERGRIRNTLTCPPTLIPSRGFISFYNLQFGVRFQAWRAMLNYHC